MARNFPVSHAPYIDRSTAPVLSRALPLLLDIFIRVKCLSALTFFIFRFIWAQLSGRSLYARLFPPARRSSGVHALVCARAARARRRPRARITSLRHAFGRTDGQYSRRWRNSLL